MKKSLLILSVASAITFLGLFGCSKSKKTEAAPIVDPIASGIEMSQALIQEGDPVNGIKTLEELNQQYPNQEEILEALAFAHTNQNNHLEAAFYFESIAKLDNTQSNLFLQAARSYEEEKEHDSALRCYNRYLDAHPADGKTWKAFAKILIKKEEYDHALQAYNRALSNENGKPTPFEIISIGKLYFKKGDLSQANDWYELGKSTAESRPYALLGQAEIRLNQEKLQDAETLLSTLIQEYPTFKTQSPYIHLSKKLQSAKAKLAALAKAAAEAQIVTETQTATDAQAPTVAHILDAKSSDNESATASNHPTSTTSEDTTTTASATITQPEVINADTFLSEANAAFQSHETDKAIRLYWKAAEAEPKSEKSWIALSQLYLNLQDFPHAQSTALEAMRVNPYSEAAAINYVNVLNPNTDRTEYFSEINRLKQQFPNSAPLVTEISKSYEQKLHNPRNAYYTYLQFLQKNPTHPQKPVIEADANRLYKLLNPTSASPTPSLK